MGRLMHLDGDEAELHQRGPVVQQCKVVHVRLEDQVQEVYPMV